MTLLISSITSFLHETNSNWCLKPFIRVQDTESFAVAVRGVSSFVADNRCFFGVQILGSCLDEDGEGGGVGVRRSDHQLCFDTSL